MEINEDRSSPLFDTDPDVQYLYVMNNGNANPCDYYLENNFNYRCKQLVWSWTCNQGNLRVAGSSLTGVSLPDTLSYCSRII